jgi:hypothetical protein
VPAPLGCRGLHSFPKRLMRRRRRFQHPPKNVVAGLIRAPVHGLEWFSTAYPRLVRNGEISPSESPRIKTGCKGRKLGPERSIHLDLQPTSPDHLAGALGAELALQRRLRCASGAGQGVGSAGFRSCSRGFDTLPLHPPICCQIGNSTLPPANSKSKFFGQVVLYLASACRYLTTRHDSGTSSL